MRRFSLRTLIAEAFNAHQGWKGATLHVTPPDSFAEAKVTAPVSRGFRQCAWIGAGGAETFFAGLRAQRNRTKPSTSRHSVYCGLLHPLIAPSRVTGMIPLQFILR
jgi:hypothetical protein